jgi:SAM-dependent methyltransferase
MQSDLQFPASLVGPAVFTDDYLYFYRDILDGARRDRDLRLIMDLSIAPIGARILDVGCGYGRLSNGLAKAGYEVVGCDTNPAFLDIARSEAGHGELAVRYEQRDMRAIAAAEEFDAVISWYTSFGYFDDAQNRDVLRRLRTALKPGGKLVMDLNNRDALVSQLRLTPEVVTVVERGHDMLVDRVTFNQKSGRSETRRAIVRAGKRTELQFWIRMPTFSELTAWLSEAGFGTVAAYDERGEEFSVNARRLVVVAHR